MNDDRFMHSLRREPRPEFARGLWKRLDRGEASDRLDPAPRRLAPALAVAFGALAIVALFVFPSVRASAQAFLDLFRVRNFVAVNVDPERFRRLEDSSLDLKKLIGSRLQVIQEPGRPQPYPSASAAGAMAGLVARTPGWLPSGLAPDSVWLSGEGRLRVTADVQRLREIMNLLEVRDLAIPGGLDGAVVEVHAFPAVRQTWKGGSERVRRAMLVQTRSPEVSLPAGLELARVAEIGLRLLGMPDADARRLADRTDWRSTLVVPVPANVASFHEVEVDGARGLLVAPRQTRESRNLLLWSKGDQVFALGGNLSKEDLLQMAGSLR